MRIAQVVKAIYPQLKCQMFKFQPRHVELKNYNCTLYWDIPKPPLEISHLDFKISKPLGVKKGKWFYSSLSFVLFSLKRALSSCHPYLEENF